MQNMSKLSKGHNSNITFTPCNQLTLCNCRVKGEFSHKQYSHETKLSGFVRHMKKTLDITPNIYGNIYKYIYIYITLYYIYRILDYIIIYIIYYTLYLLYISILNIYTYIYILYLYLSIYLSI